MIIVNFIFSNKKFRGVEDKNIQKISENFEFSCTLPGWGYDYRMLLV